MAAHPVHLAHEVGPLGHLAQHLEHLVHAGRHQQPVALDVVQLERVRHVAQLELGEVVPCYIK